VAGSGAWQPVFSDVEILRESCNVYAVKAPAGTIFVNAGTGTWLDTIPERFARPFTLLSTHYFRDHSAGAAKASRMGMTIFVPEGEVEIFADPLQHFRERQSYIVYDNIWDHFAPIEPANVKAARDYDILDVNGVRVTVLPLPGVTPNHCGYALVTPVSKRELVFVGESIHSSGRVARIAPFQYDYNDLGGAVNAYFSATELRRRRIEALLPSLGEPILQDTDGALASLQDSLRRLCAGRPSENALIDAVDDDRLERVSEHVWMTPRSEALSWYLISDTGKALVIDYGYGGAFGAYPPVGAAKLWHWPLRPGRARRRVLLHGIAPLRRQLGIDRIDVVLISHFHDDHVAGVPMLQRVFGTECWVPENTADLLAHPEAHDFPCDWPHPINVDRRLPLDKPFKWENFTFQLSPMSGHTRFSAAIGFEADGIRYAHTGDQFFITDHNGARIEGNWTLGQMQQNHVYRNGAFVDSYRETAALMREWRPQIVLSGHRLPMHTDEAFFQLLDNWGEEFAEMHHAVMVLGDNEPHFDVDSWGGWIWPYRIHVQQGERVRVRVTVRNPMPSKSELTVRLVGPDGWRGDIMTVEVPPRAEASCDLSILSAGPCRRQPIAAELLIGDRTFGQVAEALVTVGGPEF
jgi:glyoxylase-like metal-dependent hydrolase (beta-lactamase superfamily II)